MNNFFFLLDVGIQSNNNLYSITKVYSIKIQDHNGMKMCNKNIAN